VDEPLADVTGRNDGRKIVPSVGRSILPPRT
jgi:hypothetical protein